MESLLKLLHHEHDIVREIERYEYNLYVYRRELQHAEDYSIDCKAKDEAIARWNEMIEATTRGLDNSKTELRHAQYDIRMYFEETIKLKTKDLDH